MATTTFHKENTDGYDRLYSVDLALKGVSALIASISISMREGNVRPTDEMVSDALYAIEVQIDQIVSEIERHDEEELDRLRAISKHFATPMNELYDLV